MTTAETTGEGCGGLSCQGAAGLLADRSAPEETVILLHPPVTLVAVSIVMDRERQQNDSRVNGYGPVSSAAICANLRALTNLPPPTAHC